MPDAFFGEEILAVIIPKAGEQLTEQELRDYCWGQISNQKILRYFRFVESYLLTGSGNVQKFVLQDQAIKELGPEDVANVRTAKPVGHVTGEMKARPSFAHARVHRSIACTEHRALVRMHCSEQRERREA
jgi:hypothetical protein